MFGSRAAKRRLISLLGWASVPVFVAAWLLWLFGAVPWWPGIVAGIWFACAFGWASAPS